MYRLPHANTSLSSLHSIHVYSLFFFKDTATTEIYTLSLHDALPILVEHVDRDAAARVPIAGDAQPARRRRRDQPARDLQCAVLVEGGVVAEGTEEQLQGLAFEDHRIGHVIDHEMRKIGVAGDREQAGELG